jgi:hypothetical protein
MSEKSDWLLGLWVFCAFAVDVFFIGGAAYITFWRGRSAWWILAAIVVCQSPTLYKVLARRFGVTL